VLRLAGGLAHADAPFTLVGLPPDELTRLRWRSDTASQPPQTLARRIAFAAPLHGLGLTSNRLVLPVRVHGDTVTVDANIRTRGGDFVRVRLGTASGTTTLRGGVPAGGLLFGLTLGLTNTGLHGAANGGTGAQTIDRGTLELGRAFPGWIGTNGVQALGPRTISYVVSPQLTSRFRARQLTDGHAVPVLATPNIAAAAAGGRLVLSVEGQPLVAQVVGTINRFPSVDGDAVVADGEAVATALNVESPGAAATNEIWLSTPNVDALRRPPFNVLAIDTHAQVESTLRADPLARGSLLVLAGAAAVALALALVGIVLGLVADLRDEHGELFDLESQGARPALLRAQLRLRAVAVAVFGLAGGLATGAILSALAVGFVVLTAAGARPEPPLRLALGWPVVALGLGLLLLLGGVIVAAITRRAFRARTTGRYTEVGA
jgi:hypothetical protein